MSERRSPLALHVGWHALLLGVLLWAPGFVAFRGMFWDLPGQNPHLVLGLAGVYALTAVVSLLSGRTSDRPRLVHVGSAASVGMAVLFLGMLLLPDPRYSRLVLISGAGLAAGGLLLPCLPSALWKFTVVSVAGAAAVGVGLFAIDLSLGGTISEALGAGDFVRRIAEGPTEDRPRRRTEVLRTNRHTLLATYYHDHLPEPNRPVVSGGALAPDPRGDAHLLVRARGDIHRFRWSESGELEMRSLGLRVPVNNAEFEADAGSEVPKKWFRVADLLATADSEGVRIFASHHFWKREDQCFVVRVSSTVLPSGARSDRAESADWTTVFESTPCLPIKSESRGVPFAGLQIGGDMTFVDPDTLLLTVGDHQFDGWYGEPNLVQDMTAHYGKTVSIHLPTGHAEIFSVGHRNAQGITVDGEGRIWSTDHGPEGGDELNLLEQGGDYGWPYHTYGTRYGGVSWPPGDSIDDNVGDRDFRRPVHAWVPSIGISEVVSVSDSTFHAWHHDLLVASLQDRQLWRLKLKGDQVAFAEPIAIEERIRDVVAPGDGSLVLWTDQKSLVRIEPSTALEEGSRLFALRCGGCHETDPEANAGIGPNLRGVLGRPVASSDGFDYSRALAGLDGRWTESRVDAYMANPDSFAPGTTMEFEGISDSVARASIIRYMKSLE